MTSEMGRALSSSRAVTAIKASIKVARPKAKAFTAGLMARRIKACFIEE